MLQPNEALGFMSVTDGTSRTSTARVKETAELSIIDGRKFRFMGRRGAELCALHHGRHGSPNPRHERGELAAICRGRLLEHFVSRHSTHVRPVALVIGQGARC
jgi:CRP-like cAMP-binding protein